MSHSYKHNSYFNNAYTNGVPNGNIKISKSPKHFKIMDRVNKDGMYVPPRAEGKYSSIGTYIGEG